MRRTQCSRTSRTRPSTKFHKFPEGFEKTFSAFMVSRPCELSGVLNRVRQKTARPLRFRFQFSILESHHGIRWRRQSRSNCHRRCLRWLFSFWSCDEHPNQKPFPRTMGKFLRTRRQRRASRAGAKTSGVATATFAGGSCARPTHHRSRRFDGRMGTGAPAGSHANGPGRRGQ